MPEKYKEDDLLSLQEVADVLGYAKGHLDMLFSPGTKTYDPSFRQIRIKTDVTYRKAFDTKAQYVFRYGDVKRWFNERQSRPSVQAWNEARGIIVE